MKPNPKKFYNEEMPGKLGKDYEHARWHSNPFQEAQYAMMRSVMRRFVLPQAAKAKRILEVGPGPGTWTKFLLERNPSAEYVLVDISAEMLSRAQANLPHGYPISYVESDFLSFDGELFDFIFSSRALEYMPDKAAAIKKIASLLTPQGTAAVFTKMPKPFLNKAAGREMSDLHSGQIGPAGLIELCQKNGLSIRTLTVATATVPGLKSPTLNTFFFKILSRIPLLAPFRVFAESYLLVFQKP